MADKKQEKKKSHKAGRNRKRSNYSEHQKMLNKRKRIEKHLHGLNRKAARTGKAARVIHSDVTACKALRSLGTKRPEILKAAESLPMAPIDGDWRCSRQRRRHSKYLPSPAPPTGSNYWRKNYGP